jgi:peptidoglycan/LPS O-acetylase OafA/YrhL
LLLNIQALRGLAALLVVMVHLEPLARACGLPPRATAFGHSGVDVFFVVSGLIMVVTTWRRPTAQAFLRNRLTRVAPLYWTVTLAVFGLALAAPGLLQATRADPVHLLQSLAFIAYVRDDGMMQPIISLGWTLNYEMAFYLVFALGLLAPGRLAGIGVSLALLLAAVAAGPLLAPGDRVLAFYTDPLILEFAAGMLLGVLAGAELLPAHRGWRWPAAAAGAAALAVMLVAGRIWPHTSRALVFGAPATVLVAAALVAERAGLVLAQGWIQTLGAASYAIYLTHLFCTQLAAKIVERLADAAPWLPWLMWPVALALVVVVGVQTHLRLELPLTRLARRWRPRRSPLALPNEAVRPPAPR